MPQSVSLSLEKLAKNIGYHHQNTLLLKQALTHRSFAGNHNERLEFLGDCVVNLIISQYLYQKFSNAEEGQLSVARAHLVSKKTLAKLGEKLQLADFISVAKSKNDKPAAITKGIIADCLEALAASIYLECDFKDTCNIILNWYQNELETIMTDDNLTVEKDAKSELQEWCQSRNEALPSYKTVHTEGKDHEKVFTVQCHLKNFNKSFLGTGRSQKLAQQQAAEQALQFFVAINLYS